MSTHISEERLNDYVDGELSAAERGEVERHLEECAACRAEVAGLSRLLREVAALPLEVTPPEELWVGVREETVELPARRRDTLWGMRYGLAAAAVVLIALSSALTAVLVRDRSAPRETPPLAAQPAARPPAARPPAATLVAFREAEVQYTRTAADLQAVLDTQRDRLSPETVRVLEENLRIIDQAIAAARTALAADPANAELTHALSSTYQDKIDVLERAVRLSAQT